MAVSASEKSRAAAVSALIRRDAGFRVTQSGSTRDQGIKVRTAGGRDGYPSIVISDPYESINDAAESDRIVEYRRYNIARELDKRGYTYETTWIDGNHFCSIRITGKDKAARPSKTVAHKTLITFEIDRTAAAYYLGKDEDTDATDAELAQQLMAELLTDYLQGSNAYRDGALKSITNVEAK